MDNNEKNVQNNLEKKKLSWLELSKDEIQRVTDVQVCSSKNILESNHNWYINKSL